VGLAKKVLVAGAMAPMADAAFGERTGNLDMGTAWLGLLSYALQLYFDFSGYTDMAVGLGRMFGYRIPENFNYPYVSQSVREFWRRWHITLSSWFRDYLYIPLGGGRVAPWKVQRNLLVVFVLCGLWHGASWNFVIWGLWHGLFLALERTALGRAIDRLPRPVRHVYALAAVGLGWVFFRAPDLPHAWDYFQALAGRNSGSFDYTWMVRATREYLTLLALGILGSTPVLTWLRARPEHPGSSPGKDKDQGQSQLPTWLGARLARASALAGLVLPPALLALSLMQLAAGTHSPFIYAQF
jgi:alginate O-acetyltransferase complex protein AlgI